MTRCEEENDLKIFIYNKGSFERNSLSNSFVLCEKCLSSFKHEIPEPAELGPFEKSMVLVKADHKCQCGGWCGRH